MTNHFHRVIDNLKKVDADYVDFQKWPTGRMTWVVYADLLGFASICRRSLPTAVNVLARFHRCVNLALKGVDRVIVSRFTDACYATTRNFTQAIRLAVSVHEQCLGMNEATIQRAQDSPFHHLLVPRITIGRGEVLRGEDRGFQSAAESKLIDLRSFIAGSGVVSAYELEKSAQGPALALGPDAAKAIRGFTIRGTEGAVRTAVQDWLGSLPRRPNKVVRVPWLLLHSERTSRTELWADEYDSVRSKLRAMDSVWRANFREFTRKEGEPSELLPILRDLGRDIVLDREAETLAAVVLAPSLAGVVDVDLHLWADLLREPQT